MPIRYTFYPTVSQEEQKKMLRWMTINVERDVYPKSVRRASKNSWLVTYKTDGMTSEELELYLWNKGYFKLAKKSDVLKNIGLAISKNVTLVRGKK